MGRKPTGAKPGRKTDFTADQVEFLELYGPRFQTRDDNGTLYSEVTQKWMEKFGYAGLNENNQMSVANLRLEDDVDQMMLEERENVLRLRDAAHKSIRNKLANWFRYRYSARKVENDRLDQVLQSVLEISETRPRKHSEIGMYSEMFYNSKLKHTFDKMWNEGLREVAPPKQRINFVKKILKQSWDQELQDVKDGIKQKCEEEYGKALEAWKDRTEWSATPEAYQTAFSKLDNVLPPMCDAISKYTGMVAIVTLVGPSSIDNGAIVVRSLQSVTPNDKSRQFWSQADGPAYEAFQASLIKYGEGYFSETERLARVIDDDSLASNEAASSDDSVGAPVDDIVENVQAVGMRPSLAPAVMTLGPSDCSWDTDTSDPIQQEQSAVLPIEEPSHGLLAIPSQQMTPMMATGPDASASPSAEQHAPLSGGRAKTFEPRGSWGAGDWKDWQNFILSLPEPSFQFDPNVPHSFSSDIACTEPILPDTDWRTLPFVGPTPPTPGLQGFASQHIPALSVEPAIPTLETQTLAPQCELTPHPALSVVQENVNVGEAECQSTSHDQQHSDTQKQLSPQLTSVQVGKKRSAVPDENSNVPQGRTWKRMNMGGKVIDDFIVSGPRNRAVPKHLKEGGYIAPKKGLRQQPAGTATEGDKMLSTGKKVRGNTQVNKRTDRGRRDA